MLMELGDLAGLRGASATSRQGSEGVKGAFDKLAGDINLKLEALELKGLELAIQLPQKQRSPWCTRSESRLLHGPLPGTGGEQRRTLQRRCRFSRLTTHAGG